MRLAKLFIRLFILPFLIFVPLHSTLFPQSGAFKYFKNYSPKDYGLQPQNWAILQDSRGMIYAANHGGVMEYDGVSWRVIDVPNQTVRGLAMDKNGAIYVGGINQIGLLTPDKKGNLRYQSLLPYIPTNIKAFGNIWKAQSAGDMIFFKASKYLFRWRPGTGQMRVFPAGKLFGRSFVINDELFIIDKETGLMHIKEDVPTLTPGGGIFAHEKVTMMTPYDDQNLLVGMLSKGLFLFDGSSLAPFPNDANAYLKKNLIYSGRVLAKSPGEFAIATLRGGLVIIGKNGRVIYMFNKAQGLRDDCVRFIAEDSGGQLWLALNSGLTRLEHSSPIVTYDQRNNINGLILSVIKFGPQNRLYTGTTNGIFVTEDNGNFSQLKPFAGMMGWCLLATKDSLLAATSAGVFQVESKNPPKIFDRTSFTLVPSKKDNKRIWVGTMQGLASLYLTAGSVTGAPQWKEEFRFENITSEIRTIVETGQGDLWLGTLTRGVFHITFPDPDNIRRHEVKRYHAEHGLPTGEYHVFDVFGHVKVGTEKGLFRFNENSQSFIPDATFGDTFADGSNEVFRLAADSQKNTWIHSGSQSYQATPSGNTFNIIKTPFLRIPPDQVNAIYPDPSGNDVWFAGNMSLIRFHLNAKKTYLRPYKALIRKLTVNGKTEFGGYLTGPQPGEEFIINYSDRNLRFDFAAPFFEDESATSYRVRLDGYDSDWSAWNKQTYKDYSILHAGNYKFRVQAKNIYGKISKEAGYRFLVLPPWYLTWWAYTLYAVLGAVIIYLIVLWRSSQLLKEKQRLERIVDDRTKEIKDKNQQLEQQSIKLKEMDHVKSQFFANISHEFRTPLTLIMGPLDQILSQYPDKSDFLEEKINMAMTNSRRLLALINQLLDLSKLDGGKMKLRARRENIVAFVKGLVGAFESLAQQKNIHLAIHPVEDDITLYFDPEKLEKIINNLVANALKFTPAGGQVNVTISRGAKLAISVEDSGSGINESQLPFIFDRFYQAGSDESSQHKQPGTGIGLALVKELVTLHHGTIDVESIQGQGTTFTLELPMGSGHLKPGEIDEEDAPLPHQGPAEKDLMPAPETVDNGEPEDDGGEDQDKDLILVVEDNTDVRKYIREPLQQYYSVIEAADGLEGIEKAKKHIPDLVVSDVMMPGKDGFQLCDDLKKDVQTSHIPIILLTARASDESVIQGLETGADDYITKPFNTQILLTRIKNLIDLRRGLQEKIQRELTLQPAEIAVSSVDQRFMEELKEGIEKNLSDADFGVDTLAKTLYLSRATLNRKIKALSGQSTNRFIQSYRLKRAAQLLKAGFGNVTEVAFEVGFSNSAYFTKCFKEKFHQTPHIFQDSHSGTPEK